MNEKQKKKKKDEIGCRQKTKEGGGRQMAAERKLLAIGDISKGHLPPIPME
jgi:hypothetical protein